jgi:hypothetical protein
MTATVLVITGIVAVAAVSVATVMVRAFRKTRGTRLVTCPETRQTAAVEVNAAHAALTAALGHTDLRLQDCSRWPERENCGQECLRQIDVAPEDCLVRTILTKWYHDHPCALCGRPFEHIESWGHRTALLAPDGKTLEWSAVQAEKLPEVLTTHKPVCWNCHVAETLRRQHPELVIDRPSTIH